MRSSSVSAVPHSASTWVLPRNYSALRVVPGDVILKGRDQNRLSMSHVYQMIAEAQQGVGRRVSMDTPDYRCWG